MKLFVVTTMAVQIDGDLFFTKLEKAYPQASEAENHVKSLAKQFEEVIPVADVGPINCRCTRAVLEVEVDLPDSQPKSPGVITAKA